MFTFVFLLLHSVSLPDSLSSPLDIAKTYALPYVN